MVSVKDDAAFTVVCLLGVPAVDRLFTASGSIYLLIIVCFRWFKKVSCDRPLRRFLFDVSYIYKMTILTQAPVSSLKLSRFLTKCGGEIRSPMQPIGEKNSVFKPRALKSLVNWEKAISYVSLYLSKLFACRKY